MSVNYTLSYSDKSKGWPSFYSFIPDFMIGMNSYFYTFKNGNLFRHNTNDNRNEYYGVPGTDPANASTITSVFNPEPTLSIKLFKTLSFESNAAWTCTNLLTDLSQGSIPLAEFEQKEGEWYAYVRHNSGVTNFALRYANGLGNITNVAGPNNALVLTFGGTLGNIITTGAQVFTLVAGAAPVLAGQVDLIDKNNNTITIDTTIAGATAPNNGDFLLFVNNTLAESYGMRGYYMEFTLSNNLDTPVELFSVGSSAMKSYP